MVYCSRDDAKQFIKDYENSSPLYKEAVHIMRNMLALMYQDIEESICSDPDCVDKEECERCGYCKEHCMCSD